MITFAKKMQIAHADKMVECRLRWFGHVLWSVRVKLWLVKMLKGNKVDVKSHKWKSLYPKKKTHKRKSTWNQCKLS